MDLDRLKSFLQVAETRSFSLAAASLNVTQSTVSARIQALENEVGKPLFERGPRGTELTKAGVELESYAKRIAQLWEQACENVASPKGFRSVFRLGGPIGLWDTVMSEWVIWMRKQAPDVALYLEAGYSRGLFDQVSSGVLDAAILYLPRQRFETVVEQLLQEEIVLVRHPEMVGPWSSNYILIDWGKEFISSYQQTYPNIPPPAVTTALGIMGLNYIRSLKAAGYVSRVTATQLIAEGKLQLVEDAPRFQRPVVVAYSAHPRSAELLDLALQGLRTTCKDLERSLSVGSTTA